MILTVTLQQTQVTNGARKVYQKPSSDSLPEPDVSHQHKISKKHKKEKGKKVLMLSCAR